MDAGAMVMDGSRPRVVLVEDDRETRELLATLLRNEGFEVLEAANGLKLISILHADRPDLIVLDVNLSWIDGFELCRSVKRNEEFREIPVVFLSGRSSPDDARRGLESGGEAYFSKPVDFANFLSTIREITARHVAEQKE
jgi:DNA-binding response OmpR family regulator